MVERIEEYVGKYSIAVSFKTVEDQFTWALVRGLWTNADNDNSFLWGHVAKISGFC